MRVWFEGTFSRTWLEVISGQVFLRSFLLREEQTVSILNADTLNGIPAAPPTYQCQELPLPPPDGDHPTHWTPHLCSAGECLIEDGGFNLADIC
jgi:hypothetical protein